MHSSESVVMDVTQLQKYVGEIDLFWNGFQICVSTKCLVHSITIPQCSAQHFLRGGH